MYNDQLVYNRESSFKLKDLCEILIVYIMLNTF